MSKLKFKLTLYSKLFSDALILRIKRLELTKMHLKKWLLLAGIIGLPATAQDISLNTKDGNNYVIPHQQNAPTLDGKLNEPQWANALKLDLKYVTWPDENTDAPVKTEVYVYSNDNTLFVGFEAHEENIDDIRAYLRDRDQLWSDDSIGIKVDTFNDHRLAYQFFVNPLGAQADSIEDEVNKSESSAWDGIWDAEASIHENGYTIEVAIPLRVFNFNEGLAKQIWGMEFIRFLPRSKRLRISTSKMNQGNDCWICQMEHFEGLKNAKQGKNISIVPSLVLGASESRDIDVTPIEEWESDTNADIGLDLKWGITPDISLNATINPDFSQVEADVAQLSINNTFSLFFPEKRTFFLDNIDYFSSPTNLIYTRNIGSPDYGAKLTGRINKHSFGVFATNDTNTTFVVPGNLGSNIAELDQESKNVAVRYQYDFNNGLILGYTSTLRDSEGYHNYVNGIDVRYQMTQSDRLTAQVLVSDTQYPLDLKNDFCDEDVCELEEQEQTPCEFGDCDFNEQVLRTNNEDNFTDIAYRIEYKHEERDWYFRSIYRNHGEDFRADLGFVNQVDTDKFVVGGGYIWRGEEEDFWSRIRLSGDWDISHNDAGDLLEKEAELYLNLDGPLQSYIRIGGGTRDRVGSRINGKLLNVEGNTLMFTEDFQELFFTLKPISGLEVRANIDWGDEIDFANNRLGESIRVRPTIKWNINKHIQLRLRHTYKNLDADDINKKSANVFTANLSDARLTYQFSTKSFLRLSIIRSDIERNTSNYLYEEVDETYKDISTQLLYSYKVNPQTLFFAGYSDSGWQDDDIQSLKQSDRTVFMKFSYAWLY